MVEMVIIVFTYLYKEIIASLCVALACVFIIYNFRKCESAYQVKTWTKYLFLSGLLLLAYVYIHNEFLVSPETALFIDSVFRVSSFYLVLVVSALGFLFMYLDNSQTIEADSKVKHIKERAESSWEKQIKDWHYLAGLLLIIITGALIQISIIGDYYFWTDEAFSFHAGKMIMEKGEPLYDSGLYYGRASIYHNVLAWSMSIFGVDEFGSRIVNVFANILTSLLIYAALQEVSKKVGLAAVFLFMFSNLTIAMTIETRFYPFFTFAFFGMVYTYYKAFVDHNYEKNSIYEGITKLKDKWVWLMLFLLFAYLSYNTHDFFFIIIFGLAFYYALSLLVEPKWQINLFFLLCCIVVIFAGAYYLTGTFDLYYAYYEEVTLSWAEDRSRNPLYYLSLLNINIPFYLLLTSIIIATLLARISKRQRYYFALLIGALLILSPQKALAERYMTFLIPIIFIVIALSLYYLYSYLKDHKIGKYFVLVILVVYSLFHLQYYYEEINFEEYNGRLAPQKKFHFYEAMDVIDNKLDDEIILIADFHAAFTLIAHGYDVDYITTSYKKVHEKSYATVIEDRVHDHYFETPFLYHKSEDYNRLIDKKHYIVVERGDISRTEEMELLFDKVPRVYTNSN